jgi:N-acyl-phosphatidylethanolamine-hydrolysing phospholipase D
MKTVLLFFVLACILLCSCTPKPFDETDWHQEMNALKISDLYAPHYKDGQFFNPWMSMEEKSLFALIKWKTSKKRDYSSHERTYLPRVIPDAVGRIRKEQAENFIMWLGHGSFLIKLGKEFWLLDPILTDHALVVKRKTPPAISIQSLQAISDHFHVIISHNHYDHLDKDTIEGLPDGSTIITPLGFKEYINGFSGKKTVVEMDWWEKHTSTAGTQITCLPAQHWSKRITMGTNKSLWASFMIVSQDFVIYFGGDSGYFIGYKEFSRKFNKIDYALMPTTAYHPRWFMYYQHMNIGEAINAFQELGAEYFIPTQWGAFHLGDEPPGFPGLDLEQTIRESELDSNRFLIMDIGEIVELSGQR